MNKKSKIATLLMCLVCIAGLFITSSCEEDVYNTDQMSSGKVTLQVYGPRPALRGAEIRFIGTNMDKVTGVVFPLSGEVTNFTKKEKTEIRVIIPLDAGYGRIILKTPEGDIETDTDISYTEPIEITAITETLVRAGELFKIEGKFLYLITRVIFQEGAIVDLTEENLSFDLNDPLGLQTITVEVPETARSGQIILSNVKFDSRGNELGIPVELGSGDMHANIVLPVITSFSPTTIKAGNVLTITGKDLDLVQAVAFGGDKVVESFTLNEAKTSITVAVPVDALDGNVILIAKSGAESPSTEELILSLPTITSLTPSPVRNEALLTVAGTDLDLVDKVTFSGDVAGEIEEGRTATSLTIRVPIDAKEGPITFTTLAAKDALSGEMKLVKPVVTGYASSTVGAGQDVTFRGENLDLVVSVTFPVGLVVPIDSTTIMTPTSFTVTIPATAAAGDVVLTMVNGDVIECPPLTIDAPVFAFIPVLPNTPVLAGEILTVEVINADKLTAVHMRGGPTQYMLKNTTLYILVPSAANGDTELKLISSNGEISYTVSVLGQGVIETVVWDEFIDMFASPWSAIAIPSASFANASPGDVLRIYFASIGDNAEVQCFYGDWEGQFDGLKVPAGTPFYDVVLTAEILQHMMNPAWGDAAIQFQGNECIVYKISIRAGAEPTEKVLYNEPFVLSGWNNVSIPNTNFGTPSAGSIIRIYFSSLGADNEFQIFNGDWDGRLDDFLTDHPFFDEDGFKIPVPGPLYMDFTLTDEMIQRMLNQAWGNGIFILNGTGNAALSKVTLLYY